VRPVSRHGTYPLPPRFGRRATASNLYTVVNAAPSGSVRKPPAGSKKAFVSLWDARAWKLLKTRTVSQKPVTAFDVRCAVELEQGLPSSQADVDGSPDSDDGTLLAYGSSDLSVGILDAVTLRVSPSCLLLIAGDTIQRTDTVPRGSPS
jgi:prolactin regulatory element-binding protein